MRLFLILQVLEPYFLFKAHSVPCHFQIQQTKYTCKTNTARNRYLLMNRKLVNTISLNEYQYIGRIIQVIRK